MHLATIRCFVVVVCSGDTWTALANQPSSDDQNWVAVAASSDASKIILLHAEGDVHVSANGEALRLVLRPLCALM